MMGDTSTGAYWNQLPDTAVVNILSYLSRMDEKQASTACKKWREAYFHPSFWRQVDIKINIQTGCDPARLIMQRCGQFVRELTITVDVIWRSNTAHRCWSDTFDSTFPSSASEFISPTDEIISQHDDMSKYVGFYRELPHVLDGLTSGYLGLEKLTLVFFPQSNHGNSPVYEMVHEMVHKLTEILIKIVQGSSKLRYLALGHSLISSPTQMDFLRALHEKCSTQLRVVHIPALQRPVDVDGATDNTAERCHQIITLMPRLLTSLSVITMNMSYVTDGLLRTLSTVDLANLQQLNLATGFDPSDCGIAWTDDAAWGRLASEHPQLPLTISAVILNSTMSRDLLEKLMPSVPLTSLRVMVCYPAYLEPQLIERVSKYYEKCLVCLELHTDKVAVLFDCYLEEDPIVILCWKCKKLAHLIITGYKLLTCNVVAIAALRGPSLSVFEVEEKLLYDDGFMSSNEDETGSSYESTCSERGAFALYLEEKIQEVCKSLLRPWRPMQRKRRMTRQNFMTYDLCMDVNP